MDDNVFINDGRTLTKTFPAVPGLHGECVAVYRTADSTKMNDYTAAAESRNPERLSAFEDALLVAQVRTINGAPFDRDRRTPRTLAWPIRDRLLSLNMGAKPADEVAHEKNSPTG